MSQKAKTLVLDPDHFDINELQPAVDIIRKGGVIAYPTETVYGLGANICAKEAVERIFRLKKRDPQIRLPVLVSSIEEALQLCKDVPDYAQQLMHTYWPGAVTLVLRAADQVPEWIRSSENKVGLRISDHPVTNALIRQAGLPLVSTSANRSGEPPAVTAQEAAASFAADVDLVLDGGEARLRRPSTVIDVSGPSVKLLREGAVPFEQIMGTLRRAENAGEGKFRILFVCSGNSCRSPIAEGLLKKKLPEELQEKVVVESAGTLGLNGSPATEFAIQVAGQYGADISEHRSQGVSEELVKEADLIFAMAREHQRFLQLHFPEVRENVFLLRTFGREAEDKVSDSIEDPIGGGLEVYQKCAAVIDEELTRILPRLKALIQEKLGHSQTNP